MRKFTFIFLGFIQQLNAQITCYENQSTPLPVLSEQAKKDYELKWTIAKQDYEKEPSNADAIIWYGRRTAYLGKYREAIDIFSKGITMHPQDARLYRHRGHRYITLRCFDQAIGDFKKAADLTKGKPDAIEPDGLPNAQNIPTSSLQSNIWYHLGLAYYLKGEYKKAYSAYRECMKVSVNPDMYVATINWYYITLLKLNKTRQAKKLLATIHPEMKIIENRDYLAILLLYKAGKDTAGVPSDMDSGNTLSSATYGYGLANYALERRNIVEAKKIMEKIINGSQWSSFGFIAAEAEMQRMK